MEKDDSRGIDVIIPYHGGYKLVRDLIGSIILYTRNIPYRITIVDDCSENASYFSTLSQLKNDAIDGVRLNEQKGFGAALNAGIRATKKPWIVMLNSDCVIDELGWLSSMHKSLINLMKTKKVGLISARTDNPPGDHPLLKSPKTPRSDIGDQVSEQALPLFCAMMPRTLFDKVGPFKEYPYGWYEDEEYYWRMKKNGYLQGVSGKAWVHHIGSATIKELWKKDPSIKEKMQENKLKCLADLKTLFGRV